MTYLISGLGIAVMMACAVALWRSTYEARSRQPHLYLLFSGQFGYAWAVVAAQLGDEVSDRLWWQLLVIVSSLLIIAGLVRLTWFMWLRNGHLRDD